MDNRAIWRGKRIDTGDWVQGYYCKMIVNTAKSGAVLLDAIQQVVSDCEIHSIEVDPSTLGQCTGLRDKNGKSIFEGDIVTQYANHYKNGSNEPVDRYNRNGVVRWNEEPKNEAGSWEVKTVDYYGNDTNSYLYIGYNGWYVISNIHDNPSLLKGGGQE